MTTLSDQAIDRLRVAAQWPAFPSDRYTVTGEIGRGGMGTVYAAVDETLGREVAIKVVNAIDGAASDHRITTESRVLACLEHPGIVPVHDAGRLLDGRAYYVMKRVHGRTLTDHLSEHGDLSERLRIFERICEAVAFAHARRILHRDLKPDNVMIGAFGEVMVMDWGVAKRLDDTVTGDQGMVIGTMGYMPPEQASGDSDLDERADVYSLGAILMTLFEGGPALSERVPRVEGPLRSIGMRAMSPRRPDRYQSVSELGDEIARFRAGHAVRAHRETPLEKARRIGRLYQTPILLVLTYMVMRAVVAVLAGW
jgi:serine/threonine protein kinase